MSPGRFLAFVVAGVAVICLALAAQRGVIPAAHDSTPTNAPPTPNAGWLQPITVEYQLDMRSEATRVSIQDPVTNKRIDEFPAGTRVTTHLYRMHLQPDQRGVTAHSGHPVGDVRPETTGPTIRQVFNKETAEKCPDPDGVAGWPACITKDFSRCLPYPRHTFVLTNASPVHLDVNWPGDDPFDRTFKRFSKRLTPYTSSPWRKSGYGGVSVIVTVELPAGRTRGS